MARDRLLVRGWPDQYLQAHGNREIVLEILAGPGRWPCLIGNSQTEFPRTSLPSAKSPSLLAMIANIESGKGTMIWMIFGLMMCGMAAMAILAVDQLDRKVPSRKQEAISWD